MVKIKSLESLVFITFVATSVVISAALSTLVFVYSQNNTMALYVLAGAIVLSGYVFYHVYKRIFKTYHTLGIQLDAINEDNYLIYSNCPYSEGVVHSVHQHINRVSQQLLDKKSRYDNNVYFVYQLIAKLNTPVIILNEHQQFIYANKTAAAVLNQGLEIHKFTSAASLGLVKQSEWQFSDSKANDQWQILSSKFVEQDVDRELVLFINIEMALDEEQLETWKKVVQVMAHEIRNTLAPISSLAQALADKQSQQRDVDALESIATHCERLNKFVNNYVQVQQDIIVNLSVVNMAKFIANLQRIYPNLQMHTDIQYPTVEADSVLLEQVFINLLTNSMEAGADQVWITSIKRHDHAVITVLDNGKGMLNPAHAFMPLYTTKKSGKGIGLTFCKNVMSHHRGKITLEPAALGTLVTLSLPLHHA